MHKPEPLFDYQGHLPECPTWDSSTQSLYWTDILQKEIHCYRPESNQHQVIAMPEEVGCFALREQGGFIVAMRTGIWLTDKQGSLQQKSAITLTIHSSHALTMVVPILMGASMQAPTGDRVTTTERYCAALMPH